MNRNDQNFMVQKIRSQYMDGQMTELEELRALDAHVKKPAHVFGYVFGTIGAVIMGAGMSLVMTDIGGTLGLENPMIPGILIGAAGLVMAVVNYPICKSILNSRKEEYADAILALSEKIMNK